MLILSESKSIMFLLFRIIFTLFTFWKREFPFRKTIFCYRKILFSWWSSKIWRNLNSSRQFITEKRFDSLFWSSNLPKQNSLLKILNRKNKIIGVTLKSGRKLCYLQFSAVYPTFCSSLRERELAIKSEIKRF